MNDRKVAIVTGSSSGIGLESALLLARNDYNTYATMRTPEKDTSIKAAIENEELPIRIVQLDVTNDSSVKNAVDHIISEAGRIDVLVMVVAKKAQDPTSPYTELMQKIMANVSELAKNASDPELVANIVLDAASNISPRLRYLAGKDVESWAAGKKNMDELEFYNMIKGVIT